MLLKSHNLILAALLLVACEDTATVTPKPDTAPTRAAVSATHQSIRKTRTHIKKAQDTSVSEGKTLDAVESDLNRLLHEQ